MGYGGGCLLGKTGYHESSQEPEVMGTHLGGHSSIRHLSTSCLCSLYITRTRSVETLWNRI